MKSSFKLSLVSSLVLSGLAFSQLALAGVGEDEARAGRVVASAYANTTDRLIVKYKASGAAAFSKAGEVNAQAAAQKLADLSGMPLSHLRHTANGAQVLKLEGARSNKDMALLARRLKALDPSIEYAEPDYMRRPMFTPNDTNYSSQWHYFEATAGLNLPAAWDKSTGTGVKVAVLDTGYRPHTDLAANIVGGYDMITDTFVSNDGNGRDSDASDPGDAIAANECGTTHSARNSSWHGTHVAGTIAAVTNNAKGVAGVAYNAKVVPVRVLGKCGGYDSDIADGIVWASGGSVSGLPANANPAKVINMSLGGESSCGTTYQTAIDSARSRGTVIIVAAGNGGADGIGDNVSGSTPANCAGVVTIAALNRSGSRTGYSNYGTLIDVSAPGGEGSSLILSTHNSGTSGPGSDVYSNMAGTSMATPHVAGVAALMFAAKSSLTPDDIESKLKSSARPIPGSCSGGCGAGLVDALAAVNAALDIVPPANNETESNNTTGTANTISTSGTVMNGAMGSSTDTDYFKVSLGAGKTLTATLTPNASSDYDLIVYNSNGTEIGRSENGTGAVDTVTVTNTGSSTYTRYIRVVYYSGGTGATNGKYTLKATF